MKKAAIYARQSTQEQNSIPQQISDLEQFCQRNNWVVVKKFTDKLTGTTTDRPGYQSLLDFVWKGKCDVVLVWKFDRFGRSMNELVKRLMEFEERGVDFVSYNDKVDTTGPMGKAIFGFIAAMAEIEAKNIRQRVKRGMQNARENGKHIGRPTVADKDDVDLKECIRLINDMESNPDSMLMPKHIQRRSGVSQTTYYRVKPVVDHLRKKPDSAFEELYDLTNAGERLVKQIMRLFKKVNMEATA